jgi:hypothetical protein
MNFNYVMRCEKTISNALKILDVNPASAIVWRWHWGIVVDRASEEIARGSNKGLPTMGSSVGG